jgi:lipoyl(octanoyl) transferase
MIQYLYLGRVEYSEGLRLQAEIAELRYQGRVENVLLLLEHPPVLTLGRNANRANVLASAELLARRGVTVHEINRGGDVTYHGPGQLVGYPIFDLRTLRTESGGRMGPVDFVRQMEEALIRLCGGFGVRAGRIKGLTGVWCGECEGLGNEGPGTEGLGTKGLGTEGLEAGHRHGGPERKIGAIGIHVSRGITSHGFAFNVTTDLRDFALIVPCGIADHAVTSLEKEVVHPAELPTLEVVAHRAARQFGMVLGEQVLAVESMDALRAQAAARAESEAARVAFPAEDAPLQVPVELERLTGAPESPVKC